MVIGKKKWSLVLALVCLTIAALLVLPGCDTQQDDGESKGLVKFAYPNYIDGIGKAHVVKEILETRMDYEVELTSADLGVIFTAIANKNVDGYVGAWLPVTHASYMEQHGDSIEALSIIYDNARLGWVVPAYVEIDSIEQLNDYRDEFQGVVYALDPGAGLTELSHQVVEEYGLDYELVESSEPAMISRLEAGINNNEWVVVTGWSPHWKFGRWDLKYLDDPKKVLGEVELVYVVVRDDFAEEYPEVAQFLSNIKLNDEQYATLIGIFEEAGSGQEMEAARQWIAENQDLVDSWIP